VGGGAREGEGWGDRRGGQQPFSAQPNPQAAGWWCGLGVPLARTTGKAGEEEAGRGLTKNGSHPY